MFWLNRGIVFTQNFDFSAAIAKWIHVHLLSCYPATPGSSPKHDIYAFIIYSQICAIFVLWKEQK